MTVVPLGDVRNHFGDVVGRVEHGHERVTVTRNGRPVAVMLSPDDLAELEETRCEVRVLGDVPAGSLTPGEPFPIRQRTDPRPTGFSAGAAPVSPDTGLLSCSGRPRWGDERPWSW